MKVRRVRVVEHRVGRIWEDGFFVHHGYRLQNEYEDGSLSREYRSEFFDRRGLDCVAIIPYRVTPGGVDIGILKAFRPPLYFRSEKDTALKEAYYTEVYEAVAGSLEPGDIGEAAIRNRASLELAEEAGYSVASDYLIPLGSGFYPSHGQSTEKIYLYAADVSNAETCVPEGDGSVNEELNELLFFDMNTMLDMCREGVVEDPKVEIGVWRLSNVLR